MFQDHILETRPAEKYARGTSDSPPLVKFSTPRNKPMPKKFKSGLVQETADREPPAAEPLLVELRSDNDEEANDEEANGGSAGVEEETQTLDASDGGDEEIVDYREDEYEELRNEDPAEAEPAVLVAEANGNEEKKKKFDLSKLLGPRRKPFGCSLCPSKYGKESRLEKHLKTAHPDVQVSVL
jgi:hypothetical protein